jgi:hypothetical protein
VLRPGAESRRPLHHRKPSAHHWTARRTSREAASFREKGVAEHVARRGVLGGEVTAGELALGGHWDYGYGD